ncbi:MAG: hypothetical protein ABSC94_32535 [Polyangiaceae bacterium]|jgi:hypothetical protein
MGWMTTPVGFTTIKANETVWWRVRFDGAEFVGPIAVAPSLGPNSDGLDSFGKPIVGSVSVSASQPGAHSETGLSPFSLAEDDGYGRPACTVSYDYHFTITNDAPAPTLYEVAIGTIGSLL